NFEKQGISVEDLMNEQQLYDAEGEVTEPLEPTEEIAETLKSLQVKPTEKITPPQIAWKQDNSNGSAILGTLGNFSLVIGKAKSRKSFFINIAISAALTDYP